MTKIFSNYSEFLSREDKTVNGVDQDFADDFENWEAMNETNKGCWNCSGCSRCSDCSDCSGCSDCSRCSRCSGCSDCSDCSRCSRCSGCSRCSDCSDCSRCSDCSGCSRCSRCSGCSGCSGCSYKEDLEGENAVKGETPTNGRPIGFPNVPVIAGIHQKVYEAASQPQALNMSDWHTCSTTHCRAGWVVFLAGAEGKILEEKTSTQFAAMQIYHASSPEIPVSPVRFFESNNEAMQDMKQCAEKEASLTV